MNGLADARIAWYPAALSLWGHLLRLMAPELFIAAQTIRPSDFWTECIMYLGRNLFSPAMRQHFTCPPGLTLNIFSSEKITRVQSCFSILRQNFNLLIRLTLVRSGFLRAFLHLNPASLKILATVLRCGLGGI